MEEKQEQKAQRVHERAYRENEAAIEQAKQAILDQAKPVKKTESTAKEGLTVPDRPRGKIRLHYSAWLEMAEGNELTKQLALDVLTTAEQLPNIADVKKHDWYLILDMGKRQVSMQRIGKRNTHQPKPKSKRKRKAR